MTDTMAAMEFLKRFIDQSGYALSGVNLAIAIDSYAAERERLVRIDEREKCAERAVKWFRASAPCSNQMMEGWLRAAIKEDGK